MAFSDFSARLLCASLVLGMAALALASCGADRGSTDVQVVNPRLVQTPGGQRSFTGTVVNHRSNALSIAQVEVALYGENGSPIETVRIDVKDIPAGDSVDFKQTIDSDRPFQQAQVQSVLTP